MESKWNMMDLDNNMQSSHQFAQQTHPQFCPSTKPTDCVTWYQTKSRSWVRTDKKLSVKKLAYRKGWCSMDMFSDYESWSWARKTQRQDNCDMWITPDNQNFQWCCSICKCQVMSNQKTTWTRVKKKHNKLWSTQIQCANMFACDFDWLSRSQHVRTHHPVKNFTMVAN